MSYHNGSIITEAELQARIKKVGKLNTTFTLGEGVYLGLRESITGENVPGLVVGVSITPDGEAYDIGMKILNTDLYLVVKGIIGCLVRAPVAPDGPTPEDPVPEARKGLSLVK